MVLFGISNMLSDIYDCAQELGKRITMIVVNMPEERRERTKDYATRLFQLEERPLITPLEDFVAQKDEEYFVVPTTPRKAALVEFLKNRHLLHFGQLIHPKSYVSRHAEIGEGVFIGANCTIGPGSILRNHVFIHNKVTVGHDSVLNEYVRLNPGSNIAGHVVISEGAMIGLGANVIEELVIGRRAVVAAGAVVTRDVEDYAMVAGVPAVVKKIYLQQH
jgi:sugar O-acyltransferase (sialic acid O-acetyltransferase NeuD family)